MIAKNPEYFLYQPSWQLTRANSEVLKHFLTFEHPKAKKIQQNLFDYLLYYYLTEQFTAIKQREYMMNLENIFQGLLEFERELNFKTKYEFALYTDKNIKNQENREILYQFRLYLLKYLSKFDQLKGPKNLAKFLFSYRAYKQSKMVFFYLKHLLEICLNWVEKEKIRKRMNTEFIVSLLQIL